MADKLINITDLRNSGRPISQLLDDYDVDSAIVEAQEVILKPQLSDRLLSDLLKYEDDPTGLPDYSLLLNGGEFTGDTSRICGDPFVRFAGVKKALVYYTISLLYDQSSIKLTRMGMSIDNLQYASQAEYKEKQQMVRSLRDMGNTFMSDTLRYISLDVDTFPDDGCCGLKVKKVPKMRTKIIGR